MIKIKTLYDRWIDDDEDKNQNFTYRGSVGGRREVDGEGHGAAKCLTVVSVSFVVAIEHLRASDLA